VGTFRRRGIVVPTPLDANPETEQPSASGPGKIRGRRGISETRHVTGPPSVRRSHATGIRAKDPFRDRRPRVLRKFSFAWAVSRIEEFKEARASGSVSRSAPSAHVMFSEVRGNPARR